MKQITQIVTGSAGTLFCLTEDGKVYQGHYKAQNVTWIEMIALERKPPQERTKPVEPKSETPDKDVSLQTPPTKPSQGHQGKNK